MRSLGNKMLLEEKIKKEYRLNENLAITREICVSLLAGEADPESVDATSPEFLSELVYNNSRSLYPLLWLQLGYDYTII